VACQEVFATVSNGAGSSKDIGGALAGSSYDGNSFNKADIDQVCNVDGVELAERGCFCGSLC